VLTAFARDKFVNAGLPAGKISVKPNCVDPDPAKGNYNGAGTYALYVGRVSQEKGVPTLLQAWRRVPKGILLRVIGDGPARAQLESEAAADGLTDITFLGHLPREQVIAAMQRARFVIFSSELYENLPLTIIEAFACGVPVIASRLGAMQEIVSDGRTGLLFTAGNAEDLARVVTRGWKEPEYTRSLGDQARAEYETKYTAAANYQQLMDIYREVIHDHAEAAGLCIDLKEVSSTS
jgi:glycosyltransferase involved in cell wall biosynthesis